MFSELLKPDTAMQALIEQMRAPHAAAWNDKLATADRLLYRRGNFAGSMDQLICDALRSELDAEIALSPGFRWGTSVLAGQPLTMEDVLAETAITYPETYVQEMTGAQIKDVLEDVCDNLFNADPYSSRAATWCASAACHYAARRLKAIGRRITELTRRQRQAARGFGKRYKVAGWASMNPQAGKPVWDVVAEPSARPRNAGRCRRNDVMLNGVDGNPGHCRAVVKLPTR